MTTSRSVSREALLERVATVPRVPLAALPTPLEHCQRLGTELGIELYIKRDDMTGLAFGGNKTRQLEFLFAEIVAEGADVGVAAIQSNWCWQISASHVQHGRPSGSRRRISRAGQLLPMRY